MFRKLTKELDTVAAGMLPTRRNLKRAERAFDRLDPRELLPDREQDIEDQARREAKARRLGVREE